MRTYAPDQRVKLFLPIGDEPPRLAMKLDRSADWYDAYRALPADHRPAMRTYTIRALRAQAQELDIEFVLHGDSGPATRWATKAKPGDQISISAPVRRGDERPLGFEWTPPACLQDLILVADETGLPAAAGIIEALDQEASPPRVRAFFETPLDADRLSLPGFVDVRWTSRQADPHGRPGASLLEALKHLDAQQLGSADQDAADAEPASLSQVYWHPAAPSHDDRIHVWIAAESAVVRDLRRLLIKDRSFPKDSLSHGLLARRSRSGVTAAPRRSRSHRSGG